MALEINQLNLKKLQNAHALSLWRLTLSISLSLLQNRFLAGWTCRVNIPTLLLDFFFTENAFIQLLCLFQCQVIFQLVQGLHTIIESQLTQNTFFCVYFLEQLKPYFQNDLFFLASCTYYEQYTQIYTSTPKIGERLSTQEFQHSSFKLYIMYQPSK